jgi:hypothetical protein
VILIPNNFQERISILVGENNQISRQPIVVWHQNILNFFSDLAKQLRLDDQTKKIPELVTFAYWIRAANLTKLAKSWCDKNQNQKRFNIGLGLSFHLCPANVPLNFAYSLVFGLLSGNSCAIRLSSKSSFAVDVLIKHINLLLEKEQYKTIKSRVLIMQYPHDDNINGFWLSQADARVIWGGDATIEYIKSFTTPPRSREVLFADRYSVAIINPQAILNCSEHDFNHLVHQLYNDIFLMDQAACSSPQLLLWLGEHKEITKAQQRLFMSLAQFAAQKYSLNGIHAMNKYVHLCDYAIRHNQIQSIKQWNSQLTTIQLNELSNKQENLRGYWGTVFNFNLESLEEFLPIISEKMQTLSYFGLCPNELVQFMLKNQIRGIDRIVPIGKTLDMNIYWDGYDIISSLSRLIVVD